MRRPFFHLRTLMVWIAFLGIGLTALVKPSRSSSALVAALTATALLTAILHCLIGTGRRRAAWAGFGLFGWAYFLTYFWDPVPTNAIHYVLGSTWLVNDVVFKWMHPREESRALIAAAKLPSDRQKVDLLWGQMWRSFHIAGHAILALVFAALGKALATRVFDSHRMPSTGPPAAN